MRLSTELSQMLANARENGWNYTGWSNRQIAQDIHLCGHLLDYSENALIDGLDHIRDDSEDLAPEEQLKGILDAGLEQGFPVHLWTVDQVLDILNDVGMFSHIPSPELITMIQRVKP